MNGKTILPLLLLLAGCSTPDQWGVMQPDYSERVADQRARETLPPQLLRPPAEERPLPVITDGQVVLSIEDAVFLAITNNRELQLENLSPFIDGAFELIERGEYDPELFARFRHDEERQNEVDRGTRELFSVEGQDSAFAAGIRQRLPTGTDLELTLEQDRSVSSRTPEQQVGRLGLTVTQALLRGFGPAVNMASIRQANLRTLASLYELRGFAEAIVADVEIAYWRFVLAREEIAIFERSLEVARTQVRDISQRIEVGRMAQTEAAAAQAELARREQALIDARSNLEAARLRLARLINARPDGQLNYEILAISPAPSTTEPIEDIESRVYLAEEYRADLQQANLLLRQSRLETIVTRNGLLPRMDLFLTIGRTGYGDTLRDSIRNIDGKTYDMTVGVELSHFVGNRTARGLYQAARAQSAQAEEAFENLRQLVHMDVHLAANEVERARQQIQATAATRRFAEATAQAEQDRFAVGASTTLQVAQSQRDLLEAQIDEVRALVNYRTALIELYLAEGTLLERRGIQIDHPGEFFY